MPVAKKLEEPPAAPGGFSIDASADTPTQRVAGRRSAAGVTRKDAAETAPIVVGLVLLAVGSAAVLAGMMLSGSGGSTAADAVDPAADEAGTPAQEPGTDVVIPGLAEYLGEPEPESPSEPPPPAEEWIDASLASADHEDVTVKVTSVQVGRPRLVNRRSGKAASPRTDFLSIALELSNKSQTTKLDYASWNRETEGVRLIDNNQNEYTAKSFASRGMEIDGQVEGGRGAVEPEKAIADVLLFEPPAADVRFLRLELPRTGLWRKGFPEVRDSHLDGRRRGQAGRDGQARSGHEQVAEYGSWRRLRRADCHSRRQLQGPRGRTYGHGPAHQSLRACRHRPAGRSRRPCEHGPAERRLRLRRAPGPAQKQIRSTKYEIRNKFESPKFK